MVTAADLAWTDQHGDLLRNRLSHGWCAKPCCGGSQLLTTITNDAWFGHSSAPYPAFRCRPRCGRSSRAAIWCGRPIPASAASSIRTDGCCSGPRSSRARSWSARSACCEPRTIYGTIGDLVRLHRARRLTLAALVSAGGYSWLSLLDELNRRYQDLSKRCRRSAELSLKPHAPPTSSRARGARVRAGLLEQPDRSAESPAAPPPRRGGRRADCRAQDEVGRSRRARRVGRPGEDVAARAVAGSRSSPARSRPARSRRCSAASTIAGTPSSPSIRAPAAPSRRTGPRCCCGCTCAGPSAAGSGAR